MNRHRKLAALVVIIIGLIFVGLGSREDNPMDPEPEMCTADLAAVFDWCAPSAHHFPCKYVPEEYADACQAGCVKRLCPEQVPCTGLDPIWCAPCTDNQGALYWFNAANAQALCGDVMTERGVTAWDNCRRAFVKERCPAWDGHWETVKVEVIEE